jgi:hypothetical protein
MTQMTHDSRDAFLIAFPEGGQVVHVAVEPGDTVVLPFDADAPLEMTTDNGSLEIRDGRDHDHIVTLQGFERTLDDPQHPVVVESSDGSPVDIATVLAETDPNLNVIACGGAVDEGIIDGTGGIYQPFEGAVTLARFAAIGCQADSADLLAVTASQQAGLLQ